MAITGKSFCGRQGRGAIKQLGKDMQFKHNIQGKLLHINKKEREEIIRVATQVFSKNGKDPHKIDRRKFEAEVLNPLAVGRYDRLDRKEIAEFGKEFGLTGFTKRIGSKYFEARMKEQREKFNKSLEPKESKMEEKTPSRKELFDKKDFRSKLAEKMDQIIAKRNKMCALGTAENKNASSETSESDNQDNKETAGKKPAISRYQTETFTAKERNKEEIKSGGQIRKGKPVGKTPVSNIQAKVFNKSRPGMSFVAYNARPYKEPPMRTEIQNDDIPQFKGLAFGDRANLNASNEESGSDEMPAEDAWKYEAYQADQTEPVNEKNNGKKSEFGGVKNDSFGQDDQKNN